LHPEAISELFAAMAYYENEQKGLGDELYREIESTLRKIEESPMSWPYYMEPFRRCRTNRFPYKLIYEMHEKGPFIVAVMHDSRDPGYWLDRV
jgi:hypothetical protein